MYVKYILYEGLTFVLLAQRKDHFRAFVKVAIKVRSNNYYGGGRAVDVLLCISKHWVSQLDGEGRLGDRVSWKDDVG
jgi:hypothetical protein